MQYIAQNILATALVHAANCSGHTWAIAVSFTFSSEHVKSSNQTAADDEARVEMILSIAQVQPSIASPDL